MKTPNHWNRSLVYVKLPGDLAALSRITLLQKMGSFKWHKALLYSHVFKTVLKEIPTYPVLHSLCHPKQQMKKRWKTINYACHLITNSFTSKQNRICTHFPCVSSYFLLHLYLISQWGGNTLLFSPTLTKSFSDRQA